MKRSAKNPKTYTPITLGIAIQAACRYAGVTLKQYGYVLALADGT